MGVGVGELAAVGVGVAGIELGDVPGSAHPAHNEVAATTDRNIGLLVRMRVIRAKTADRNTGDGKSTSP